MSRHGKNYRNARAQVDREHFYTPLEAVRLIKGAETAQFDETVEAHFNLGLNVRHAEQQLRGTLMLPHGTGRETRVAVFAEGEKAREAEEAGADVVGTADLAARIEEGFDDVHVAIGKKSFDEGRLLENYAALIDEIVRAKPAAAKGRYIKSVTLTSTMGPGIHVDPAKTRGIVEELADSADAESAREAATVTS